MIKAVIFELDGTLLIRDESVKKFIDEMIKSSSHKGRTVIIRIVTIHVCHHYKRRQEGKADISLTLTSKINIFCSKNYSFFQCIVMYDRCVSHVILNSYNGVENGLDV
jgi:hypothetical protein